MAHVERLLGTPLVESAAAVKNFSKRDLGELRAMAAELSREAFSGQAQLAKSSEQDSNLHSTNPQFGKLLALTVCEFQLTKTEAASAIGVNEKILSDWCSGAAAPPTHSEFIQAITALIAASAGK